MIAIVSAAATILDILTHLLAKDPSKVPYVSPITTQLIGIASRAAGETESETDARMAAHAATIEKYAAGPPPGAKVA